jgi:hypothetical protein
MESKILSFNENQLKKIGFGEAFTEELKAKMEQHIPLIQHDFHKEYDGDRLSATLYLKKSSFSEYYTLKKFDLQLQKEGLVETVKHTFNITDTNFGTNQVNAKHFGDTNRYTLQEAYNLLSGRPVYKSLLNSEGKHDDAWIQLNLKEKSLSNNVNNNLYQIHYGYDLEKIINNYSIKELKYERMRGSLIHSLRRGNVKKVTFVGRGKQEQQFYIYPNIVRSSLNVYDKLKQLLSTNELLDKKLIEKDFKLKVDGVSGLQQKIENKNLKLHRIAPRLTKAAGDAIHNSKTRNSQRL